MNVDDHMHSDNVLFYNLGLGSKNNITEKEWNIMTLSAILSKLGHTEVCVLIYWNAEWIVHYAEFNIFLEFILTFQNEFVVEICNCGFIHHRKNVFNFRTL